MEAQETERRRIAHELHDEIGQTLTAFRSEMAQEPSATKVRLNLRSAFRWRTGSDQVRDLPDLRPTQLDDLGLVAALRGLINRILFSAGWRPFQGARRTASLAGSN
jgi:two-component system sensor histidine kinase UhpB